MAQSPKILIIRRRYLGDIVLLGSVLSNLKRHWPAAHLCVLVEHAYAGILELNPDIDSTLEPPSSLAGWPAFALRLRRLGFTHVFNFDNTEKTALITRLTGASFRLALHHGGYRIKLPGFYTVIVNDPNERHESNPITEYYLRALPAASVPLVTREVRLIPREADVADLRRFVGASGKVLLVHPGSRSPWRVWPADRFAAVCDWVQDALDVQVVLIGGPADGETIASIRAQARTHILCLEDTPSLPRLAALASLGSAFLCHDSGPMHVAAAVGTPVVALYGSQNPVLFRPSGDGHCLLVPELPCGAACVAPDTCVPGDSYHSACVRRHSVESVCAAVREVLARAPAPVR